MPERVADDVLVVLVVVALFRDLAEGAREGGLQF